MCTLLALLAWSGAVVRGGFSFDDREAIEGNPVVEGSLPWNAAFERDYWHHRQNAGHLRPIAGLSLRLDRALFGESAWGFHATNVLLHAACVALAGVALLLIGGARAPRPIPWIGLALFAAHPALADSIAWISGRTSMLSACAGLLGAVAILWSTVPWRPPSTFAAAWIAAWSGAGLLCGLLAKEDALVFALVYAGIGAAHSRRALAAAVLGSLAAVGLYLALRARVYGSPWPAALAAPLADMALAERLASGGRGALEALRLSVLPIDYPPSYEGSRAFDVPRAGSQIAWLGALGWTAWLALGGGGLRALARRPSSLAAASALLAALACLPWMQIVPAGALFAPRFLYLPLLCAIPFVDALFTRALGRRATAAAALAIALSAALAWQRAGVYASRASFHAEVLRHEPADPRAWNDYALALEESGDMHGAERAYGRAIELDPSYGRPWSNLGRLALDAGRLEAAEEAMRRAVELGPGNAVARANLGALLARSGRHAEAAAAYRDAIRLAPGMSSAWRGLGRELAALGAEPDARAALSRALELDPSDDLARKLLAPLDSTR